MTDQPFKKYTENGEAKLAWDDITKYWYDVNLLCQTGKENVS